MNSNSGTHKRSDGRRSDQLRNVVITPGYLKHPSGSCLIEMGGTRVICSAFIENTVPQWLKGSGRGWLTAEYNMLPGSSQQRIVRERTKVGGRTQEIQRLIGRSLRVCFDLKSLGERSVLIDCDVLEADGGTRTAAITGSFVALALGLKKFAKENSDYRQSELLPVAAVSVGIVKGTICLDLHYDDDKQADIDMNVVKTGRGQYVEIQGTAEGEPFDRKHLDQMLAIADSGIETLLKAQKAALEAV